MEKKRIAWFFGSLLLAQYSWADDMPSYELKGNELIIHSSKPKKAEIPGQSSEKFTIPIDARINAFTSNDIIWDGSAGFYQECTLYVHQDFVQANRILIPKGAILSGRAYLRNNNLIEFNMRNLELPDGKRYHIDAEARSPNGKDYLRAQYIRRNNAGKRITGHAFGSVARGAIGRALGGDTITEDAARGASDAATDETQDAIESNQKDSYSKLTKNTKVQVIFLNSL